MTIEIKQLVKLSDNLEIIQGPDGSFASKLISLKEFSSGEVLATLGKECRTTHIKAYTSVQFLEESDNKEEAQLAHFELGSELVFINHSCEPNVAFHLPDGLKGLEEGRWCLKALSNIQEGVALTFAYFSTEWDMAQPFVCQCGSKSCLGEILGAKYLSQELLDRYFINDHIKRLKQKQKTSNLAEHVLPS
ncbi:hypothetical protein O181_060425 [Austropuccinia psidii MF-1]|uniref:SET domain-containing protein n=1 Tax=Austropuccinia psidii MF-1 TaxID=1389203 RepID=A0A9Q3EDB9_9BASI|nr:hypothetical protein [Austropuccinia psidii MF-1]